MVGLYNKSSASILSQFLNIKGLLAPNKSHEFNPKDASLMISKTTAVDSKQ
jgi:hypothetical protein